MARSCSIVSLPAPQPSADGRLTEWVRVCAEPNQNGPPRNVTRETLGPHIVRQPDGAVVTLDVPIASRFHDATIGALGRAISTAGRETEAAIGRVTGAAGDAARTAGWVATVGGAVVVAMWIAVVVFVGWIVVQLVKNAPALLASSAQIAKATR